MKNKKNEFSEIDSLSVYNKKGRLRLLELASDPEEMVRLYAIRALAEKKSIETSIAVFKNLKSKSALIRMETLETIKRLADSNFEVAAIIALQDRNLMVQARAALALGQFKSKQAKSALLTFRKNSTGLGVLAAETAIYLHDKKKNRLTQVIKFLESKNYRIRCSSANFLADLANKKNSQTIKVALNNALKVEKTAAARSTFQEVLSEIEKL